MPMEWTVLYEDAHLLVIDKPAGIAVHGGSGLSYGVIEALRVARQAEPYEYELVHRLDKETSGCLMISKRRSMLRTLHDLFVKGRIAKTYWTLVEGRVPEGLQTIDAPLKKNQLSSGERIVRVHSEGQMSQTVFRLLEQFSGSALLEAKPMTGRTHQIRVHAAHMGHVIAGDDKYGDSTYNKTVKQHYGLKRLFLHARQLEIPLPGREQPLLIEAPLDGMLTKCLDNLRKG
jgi:23S rRNA pseudouridine955/2504/2580 synthase